MSHPLGLEPDQIDPDLPEDTDKEEEEEAEDIMGFPKDFDPDLPVDIEKDTI